MCEISVVVPAKNERDNIDALVNELYAVFSGRSDFEIIYVDDGSDDGTYEKLLCVKQEAEASFTVIRHKKSAGQSAAIYSGVCAAHGELIVTLDADGQNDPRDIPKLLSKALEQPAGSDFCVAGYRKSRKDTAWKRFQSKVANAVRSRLLKDGTPDTGCGLKVIPRSTFLKLPYFDHLHRFIPALVRRIDGKIFIVEISHRERQSGRTKYTMLGRLGVGLVDLLGVMWLQRRRKEVEYESS